MLQGHVERGRGLVAEQDLWTARKCHRDHDALAEAAGQLVGIGLCSANRVRDAGFRHHRDGQVHGVLLRQAEMTPRSFGDLLAHPDNRVQRSHRVLEDHGDLRSHERPAFPRGHAREVPTLVLDRSRYDLHAAGEEPRNGPQRQRLAGSGFSDDAEELSLSDVECDIVHDDRGWPAAPHDAEHQVPDTQ